MQQDSSEIFNNIIFMTLKNCVHAVFTNNITYIFNLVFSSFFVSHPHLIFYLNQFSLKRCLHFQTSVSLLTKYHTYIYICICYIHIYQCFFFSFARFSFSQRSLRFFTPSQPKSFCYMLNSSPTFLTVHISW